jgi:hypothetical protein
MSEIKGKVTKVLVMESGTNDKGYWQKQGFIVKQEGQYGKEAYITAWGDKCDQIPEVGKDVSVEVSVASREYNGRYSTDLNFWKLNY